MKRSVVGLVVSLVSGGLLGCGGSEKLEEQKDGGSEPIPPSVGAHALVFQRQSAPDGKAVISTPGLSTQSGSTILVSVGRGVFSSFALPTDNKGNAPYRQLGEAHTYTLYPSSGTALYAFEGAAGGSNHVISATTPSSDEITLSAVEVRGTRVVDHQWREVLRGGPPITSGTVTTSGPATLVAFWWGDHDVREDKTARPDGGFQVIDSVLASGALVQSAVAVKHVDVAGSYSVTWTATPPQGAQLWLVAVE